MAPRLRERLAIRKDAELEEAIAKSAADASIKSPSTASAASADRIDALSVPRSVSDVSQVSAGCDDISHTTEIGDKSMGDEGDVIPVEDKVVTDNSASSALEFATQSSAVSIVGTDILSSQVQVSVDSDLPNNVTAHAGGEQKFAGTEANPPTLVPSQSGEKSNMHSDAGRTPAHHAGNNLTPPPDSVRDAEQETVQKRHIVPKRHAALKAAGHYAVGNDVTDGEMLAQKTAVAPSRKPAKRKRADADVGTDRPFEGGTLSSHGLADRKKAAARPSNRNTSLISDRPKKVVTRTVTTLTANANLKANSLVAQIVDNDNKDDDYSPTTKTARSKNAVGQKQYNLRRRKETGLLIENLQEETHEISVEAVLEAESVPILRTTRKATRKEVRASSTQKSLHSKQTAKQISATRAEGSLSHPLILQEAVTKKRKIVRTTGSFTNKYRIRFGYTPFPKNTRPSQKICQTVFDALQKHHERDDIMLERYPIENENSSNQKTQGPMHAVEEVNFHNIVKTILSQATNNDNAQTVEETLIDRFRYDFLGLKVKGRSPNYHAMRRVGEPVIARALASGGLHNIKAKQILGCLNHVYSWNMACATNEQQIEAEHLGESADFVPGMLSIDYMTSMSLQEKFDHLVSMPGIGVKTAACILSFNFEYPVFAVDTHVFRLSRMLRWLPLNARHENYAFMHLDKRVPDELKYGLHQAFWHHGQTCIRCKKGTDENTKGWKETNCPLEGYVDRSRKDPAMNKRPKPNRDEKGGELKKVKTRPNVYPHSKLTPEQAAELGYELRTIMINDGFGVRRANFRGKPLLKWVLKSDEVAIAHTDRQAITEDIKNETDDPDELDENVPYAGADDLAASAEHLLDEDMLDEDMLDEDMLDEDNDEDVSNEMDDIKEDDISDKDAGVEADLDDAAGDCDDE